MRVLLVGPLALLVACAQSEKATPDSAAAAVSPAALTDADMAGTWVGTGKEEGSDTVTVRFTQNCAAGTCKAVMSGTPDTTLYTYTIAGDSVMTDSRPFKLPPSGIEVIDRSVHRITGKTMAGRGWLFPVGKPDSVVHRYTFEATKQ